MIPEITKKFGSFTRYTLAEKYKDDPEGYAKFKYDLYVFWMTEVRHKYICSHYMHSFNDGTVVSNNYYHIPEDPLLAEYEFNDDCCSIIETGLHILYDECKQDKTFGLIPVEFDIEDDNSPNDFFEVCSLSEFASKWDEVPYWDEPRDDKNKKYCLWRTSNTVKNLIMTYCFIISKISGCHDGSIALNE